MNPPTPGSLTQETLVLRSHRELNALFDRLTSCVLDLREGRGDWTEITALLAKLKFLEADTRFAGLILGMLSPWLASVRDVPIGTPQKVQTIDLDIRSLDQPVDGVWRWPTIDAAIQWVIDTGIATKDQLKSLYGELRQSLFSPSEDIQVTEKIRQSIAESLRSGESFQQYAGRVGVELALPRAELETTFRTNTKRAFLVGQERSLAQPRVKERFRWLYYAATKDNRTRPTHWYFDGWVCEMNTPLHHLFLQLQGEHNCRCAALPLDEPTANRYGVKTISDVSGSILSQISVSAQAV